jgi:hypothetical protein
VCWQKNDADSALSATVKEAKTGHWFPNESPGCKFGWGTRDGTQGLSLPVLTCIQ